MPRKGAPMPSILRLQHAVRMRFDTLAPLDMIELMTEGDR
jgi:hypothetical protein